MKEIGTSYGLISFPSCALSRKKASDNSALKFFMTGKTWSDQVSRVVVIERTPTTEMMSLQFTRSSTILAFSAHFAGDAPVPRAIARNDSTLRAHSSSIPPCFIWFAKQRQGRYNKKNLFQTIRASQGSKADEVATYKKRHVAQIRGVSVIEHLHRQPLPEFLPPQAWHRASFPVTCNKNVKM